jgi:tRNA (adenine37-N6)-methyltransferase
LTNEQRLRQQERAGRISAEKKLAALLHALQESRYQHASTAIVTTSTSTTTSTNDGGSSSSSNSTTATLHDDGGSTDGDTTSDASLDIERALALASGSLLSSAPEHWRMLTIGYLSSCFKKRHGCPRQGSIAPASRGILRLCGRVAEQSLQALEQYSHVWLIFIFHANTNMHCQKPDGQGVRAKIKPPRLDHKVGVYSTRSPHRYNPIGLTLARVERVDGRELHLSAIDLIDGTPVLDIRPYIPAYDSINAVATADGALGGTTQPLVRVPSWIDDSPDHPPLERVLFTSDAQHSLERFADQQVFEFYSSAQEVKDLIHQVLLPDVRSNHRRKVGTATDQYEVFVDRLRVVFTVDSPNRTATVLAIEQATTAKLSPS